MGHRYYDPQAGRFLTRDPSGYGGGVNLYEYGDNDSVDEDDPSGFNPGSNTWYKSPFYSDPAHYHGPPPPVPPAPAGFSYDRNIAQAREMGNGMPDPGGVYLFYSMVKKGSIWDPKKGNPHWDDAGNFNFGGVGLGYGFYENTVLAGAGYAQETDDPTNCYKQHPEWGLPPGIPGSLYFLTGKGPDYGDDPHGQAVIKTGFTYFKYWWLPHHQDDYMMP